LNKNKTKIVIFVIILFTLIFIGFNKKTFNNTQKAYLSNYPYGRNFAFTITDDPDGNTLEKIKPVYDFLLKEGLKTTAAVWLFPPMRTNGLPDLLLSENPGKKKSWPRDTCERPEYLNYMRQLKSYGFEIAMHGASTGNDQRDETIRGYENFHEYFGCYPDINIMHAQNLENVYWGKKVVSNKIFQKLMGLVAGKANIPFSGEDPSSVYFWGDILQSKTKYVRLFGTDDINTLKFNPSMPYHDPDKPFVNHWFSFSDGSNPKRFSKLLGKDNIKQLADERGACIVYTHFAHGFFKNGKLDENFMKSIKRITSEPDGWFVPCSTLLDRLNLMKRVFIEHSDIGFVVYNLNNKIVDGLTIIVAPDRQYYGSDGNNYLSNGEGEIIIEKMFGNECLYFSTNKANFMNKPKNKKIHRFRPLLIEFDNSLFIYNNTGSDFSINEALMPDQEIYDLFGNIYNADQNKEKGHEIRVLKKNEGRMFLKNKEHLANEPTPIGFYESFNMVLQRALLYAKHNKIYEKMIN
jgi:hypothetical protein